MRNDYIVKKLYVSFVIVSILSALTATVGMLIDNIIVGAFLGETSLGAMGIVGPVSLVFSAFGNICSGGGTARAAQALGKGNIDKYREIFTVTMLFVLVSGLILTIVGVTFAESIAQLLGAKGELLEPSADYLRGFFLGAIPTIMLTAIAGFVKIDGSPRLPLLSIVVMSVANIILDIMMVTVFDLGMFGMALATAISYCLAVLTGFTHFFKKNATLRLAKPNKGLREMGNIITTGMPTAISRICDTIKVMVLNNMLVAVVGVAAVTAMNVRTQASSLFGAFILGLAQASVPLLGMFYGEEDPIALKDTLKNTLKIGLLLNGVVAVALFIIAPAFVGVMNVTDPNTLKMSVAAVRIYAVSMPIILINMAMMSFYQSTRKTAMATAICIMQSLVFTLLISMLLIKPLGDVGVWIALLSAEVCTALVIFITAIAKKGRFPRTIEDIMRLEEGFGDQGKDKLEISVGNDINELMNVSQGIYKFGSGKDISKKLLQELSLCIEEMGMNIINHAFKPGKIQWFDIKILNEKDKLMIRLRDNGAAFDPTQYKCLDGAEGTAYGIRIIQGIADEIVYRRALGLNNLIIVLKKQEIAEK